MAKESQSPFRQTETSDYILTSESH
jgi:hypothetical protein